MIQQNPRTMQNLLTCARLANCFVFLTTLGKQHSSISIYTYMCVSTPLLPHFNFLMDGHRPSKRNTTPLQSLKATHFRLSAVRRLHKKDWPAKLPVGVFAWRCCSWTMIARRIEVKRRACPGSVGYPRHFWKYTSTSNRTSVIGRAFVSLHTSVFLSRSFSPLVNQTC